MPVKIAETVHGDVVLLRPDRGLPGREEAIVLDSRMRALLLAGTRGLVLDCSEVTALGSTAVRVLLGGALKLAGTGGRLLLVHPSDRLRRALQVSGFDKDFAVAADIPAALASAGLGADPAQDAERELAHALLRLMGAPPGPMVDAQGPALDSLGRAVASALGLRP